MNNHQEHVRQLHAARDSLIDRAVTARKIAPDRADDYRRMFDADPRGVHHLLTAPVESGGLMAGNAAAVAPFDPVPTEYPRAWISGSRPTGAVGFEDQATRNQGAAGFVPGHSPQPEAVHPGDAGRVTVEP